MVKAYKVVARKMYVGNKKGKTVYSVRPVSFGTLNTNDVAKQIAAESTASPGDVKAVLDRYAYYVKENLKKGYNIELLDFGRLYLRFIKGKAVDNEKQANANLVKALVPGFRPSYTKLANGTRLYDLTPEKIEIMNYDDLVKEKKESETADSKASTGGSADDSGSGDSGNAGSDSSDSGNSGSDSSSDSGSTGSDSGSDSGSTSGGLTDDNG